MQKTLVRLELQNGELIQQSELLVVPNIGETIVVTKSVEKFGPQGPESFSEDRRYIVEDRIFNLPTVSISLIVRLQA
jgi:hypothetical protein